MELALDFQEPGKKWNSTKAGVHFLLCHPSGGITEVTMDGCVSSSVFLRPGL